MQYQGYLHHCCPHLEPVLVTKQGFAYYRAGIQSSKFVSYPWSIHAKSAWLLKIHKAQGKFWIYVLSYVLDRRVILKYIELCNNISIIHKKLQLSYHLLLMTTKNAQVIYLRLMCLKYYLNFSGWVVEWLSSYDLVKRIFKFLPPVINLLWSACCPFYCRALR